MKKIFTYFYLLSCIVLSEKILADPFNDLQARLKKVTSLYSSFTQQIIDNKGKLIQKNIGEFWIKKPKLINWHVVKPEEYFIIINQNTLWFYIPKLKHVSIKNISDFDNNLLKFITFNENYKWNNYIVTQENNMFTLTKKNNNDIIKKFTINISSNGVIYTCSMVDQNNFTYLYFFKKQKKELIDSKKFVFSPSEEISIDDERYNLK